MWSPPVAVVSVVLVVIVCFSRLEPVHAPASGRTLIRSDFTPPYSSLKVSVVAGSDEPLATAILKTSFTVPLCFSFTVIAPATLSPETGCVLWVEDGAVFDSSAGTSPAKLFG